MLNHKINNRVLVILFLVVFLLSFAFILYHDTDSKEDSVFIHNSNLNIPTSEETYFFIINDLFDSTNNITISDLMNQDDALNKLKKINIDFHSSLNFIELVQQPVEYVGTYSLPLEFVNGYSRSNGELNLSNQQVTIKNKAAQITPLNAIQLDYSATQYFDLPVNSGRQFTENDFKLSHNIPVILGGNYKEYYQLNDTLEFYYIGRKTEAMVVGFLPSNTKLPAFQDIHLDSYILMPLLSDVSLQDLNNSDYLSEDGPIPADELFVKFLYLQKNSGCVVSQDLTEFEHVVNVVDKISKSQELPYIARNYYEHTPG